MTARKRKQPDKRSKAAAPKPRRQHIAVRALRALARSAGRNPGFFGGSLAFAVVFSFVAANAVWYQPGAHPAPFLRTRVPFTHPQPDRLGVNDTTQGLDPRKVTTFVIRREDDPALAMPADAAAERPDAVPAGSAQKAPATRAPVDETASIIRQADQMADQTADQPAAQMPARMQSETSTAQNVAPDAALVARVQSELIRRGLYDGPADGRTGPKTAAAIAAFEKQADLPQTGLSSRALLARLSQKPETTLASALPAARPYGKVKAEKGDLDPVAAAIHDAEVNPDLIPKADIPAASELVMNIQKGLTNLAYTEVSIDGVAGEQTRAAIRHFEKHYRLSETGQPSPRVLKKMKEIGAL